MCLRTTVNFLLYPIMNMCLNMKYWRTRFSQIKGLDTRANLCKHNFYPATIKNDNGAFAMRSFFDTRTEATTPSIKKIDDIM